MLTESLEHVSRKTKSGNRVKLSNRKYPNFKWPAFLERIDEMNDKNPNGSRTGDILIFMDSWAEYQTVIHK